jgi:hypothetical protein
MIVHLMRAYAREIRPADHESHLRLRPCAGSRYVPEPAGSKQSICGASGWVPEWLKGPVLKCVQGRPAPSVSVLFSADFRGSGERCGAVHTGLSALVRACPVPIRVPILPRAAWGTYPSRDPRDAHQRAALGRGAGNESRASILLRGPGPLDRFRNRLSHASVKSTQSQPGGLYVLRLAGRDSSSKRQRGGMVLA